MPEPVFFILLVVSSVAFAICAVIAAGLFVWGWRRKSKLLNVLAGVTLFCGFVVWVPFLFVLSSWVWYWTFGSKQ